MQGYKPKELSDWLNIPASTIRYWSNGEFRVYLSPTAQGGGGRRRFFGDRDARIIALISDMRASARTSEEIHVTLQQMQNVDWADLPPMPHAPSGMTPPPMELKEVTDTRLTTQRQSLMREIVILQERDETLTADLESERTRRADLETELRRVLQELGKWRGVVLSGVALVIVLAIVAVALAAVLLTRGGG